MGSELKDRIKQDMMAAMRSQDKARLGVIRMLQAAIKQREVDERVTLEDNDILTVVEKMIKQRKESATQFEQGNRPELAAKEKQEIEMLQAYMPSPLSHDELDKLINEAINTHHASSIKDMSKVMQALKANIQGRADMGEVSNKVRQRLAA